MPLVEINVQKCIQDSQEFGSTDEHMMSRVFFSVELDGVPKGNDYCDIKQIVGSTYSSRNMEVGRPKEYRGPYDHRVFSDEIAAYFSRCVGSNGAGISFGKNAQNIRMRNNTFAFPYRFQFEAEGTAASW